MLTFCIYCINHSSERMNTVQDTLGCCGDELQLALNFTCITGNKDGPRIRGWERDTKVVRKREAGLRYVPMFLTHPWNYSHKNASKTQKTNKNSHLKLSKQTDPSQEQGCKKKLVTLTNSQYSTAPVCRITVHSCDTCYCSWQFCQLSSLRRCHLLWVFFA